MNLEENSFSESNDNSEYSGNYTNDNISNDNNCSNDNIINNKKIKYKRCKIEKAMDILEDLRMYIDYNNLNMLTSRNSLIDLAYIIKNDK